MPLKLMLNSFSNNLVSKTRAFGLNCTKGRDRNWKKLVEQWPNVGHGHTKRLTKTKTFPYAEQFLRLVFVSVSWKL